MSERSWNSRKTEQALSAKEQGNEEGRKERKKQKEKEAQVKSKNVKKHLLLLVVS